MTCRDDVSAGLLRSLCFLLALIMTNSADGHRLHPFISSICLDQFSSHFLAIFSRDDEKI